MATNCTRTSKDITEQKPAIAIGIDLAKDHHDLVGLDEHGKQIFALRNVSPLQLKTLLAKQSNVHVLMEACGGSMTLANHIIKLNRGHYVSLVAPEAVKGIRGCGQKNDIIDAAIIARFHFLGGFREVPIKSLEQQQLQTYDRILTAFKRARIQWSNRIHALLVERGCPVKGDPHRTESLIWDGLLELVEANRDHFTDADIENIKVMREEWIHQREQELNREKAFEALAETMPQVKLLTSIPGIGWKAAVMILLTVGSDLARFKNGRSFSASLGLVPRQYSTGGKSTLGHITKHGSSQARRTIYLGATAILYQGVDKRPGNLGNWIRKMRASGKPKKVMAIALASKLARIDFQVLKTGTEYTPQPTKGASAA